MREPDIQWSCRKAISATQPEGALKAEALSHIKCNPREVSYRNESVVTLQSALPRLHTQLRGTCESYQFGTNTTPHPRLECFHSISSCSTQPHETWVISHDYTETHSPIKPGLGSLFYNSSPNPKHTKNWHTFRFGRPAVGRDCESQPDGHHGLRPVSPIQITSPQPVSPVWGTV